MSTEYWFLYVWFLGLLGVPRNDGRILKMVKKGKSGHPKRMETFSRHRAISRYTLVTLLDHHVVGTWGMCYLPWIQNDSECGHVSVFPILYIPTGMDWLWRARRRKQMYGKVRICLQWMDPPILENSNRSHLIASQLTRKHVHKPYQTQLQRPAVNKFNFTLITRLI